MSNQINQKDANQDQEIALLKHRIEDVEELSSELRLRVRKLERWVWGAGAVISAAITIIGLAMAADAKEGNYGGYDTAKQEELLQFQGSGNQQGS
tara:strand:+ start:2632 stop:2916 length:285 start_codon:yes stop_codon:yes gene_type:complete